MAITFTPAATRHSDRGGPAQPMLIVENLRKHFAIKADRIGQPGQTVKAVDGVSFAVAKGETLGIVGESGCGKSTLARLLMQLMGADDGSIVFDGDAVGEARGISVKELRRQMQMVFQDSYSSINPRLPIRDTISFAPIVHGMPKTQARALANQLLERVGLDPRQFGGRYPHQLSGGQRQRVNIARALALSPRLVVLDEAVSALDKSVEAQVLNLLSDLKDQLNLTYIFISHDLNVVQFIADRVLVMYLGRVMEVGPVEEIYKRPRHPYTRALLGSRLSMDPDERMATPPLSGDPPNPVNPPSGCRFRTRCPFAEDVCAGTLPSLADVGGGHQAACLMADPRSGHSRAGEFVEESLPC
ncbi:ABC transporter ATP-binding protein [Microvirga pudoricolor]|uniref:ABC transporter ATP-binding protein n=1 Tax=Microvirga pudoricolor TaxID=2778729 RepID=UPI001950770E|nr:ABC transporter ATP-binding protein [Microvirga pudoricolor]MBM6595223.1 ABC transporter ATP-binding protein [Microvirga pudoricolor]